jgi:hypothetical protein
MAGPFTQAHGLKWRRWRADKWFWRDDKAKRQPPKASGRKDVV